MGQSQSQKWRKLHMLHLVNEKDPCQFPETSRESDQDPSGPSISKKTVMVSVKA
jgi:hypothetical protein